MSSLMTGKVKNALGVFKSLSELNSKLLAVLKKGQKEFFELVSKWVAQFWKMVRKAFGVDNRIEALLKYYKSISDNIAKNMVGSIIIQKTDDIEILYREAKIANEELITITEKIAKETSGKAGFRPKNINYGLKSKERSIEKINADYGGKASKLLDIAGSKVVYESLDELYIALIKISKEYTIVKIKDRIQQPLLSGYRDILMNIKLENSHIVEFRMHLKEMDEAAEIGHKFYTERRTLEAYSKERELSIIEQKLIEKLINHEKLIYNKAWEKIINKN